MPETLSSYAKHHKYVMGGLAVLVVLVTAVGVRVLGKKPAQTEGQKPPRVELLAAQDYLKSRGTVSANGIVESLEQAELRSQTSAPVTRIYVQIGQKVTVGQTLVTLENRDMSAQLAQSEAMLKAAQARLDEMRKGLRTEEINVIEAQVNAAKQTLADTRLQQDVMVKNALSGLLNAGLGAEPGGANIGSVTATVTGSYTGTEQGKYTVVLYATGGGVRFQYNGLESGSGLVDTVPQPLGTRGLFIQFSDKSPAASNTWTVNIPNTKSPSYTTANSAYEAAVQGRESAINAATSAVEAAQRQMDLKVAGASNEQIRAQEAAVDQARASVAGISAQLSKTIIRSPISGTVASLPVKYGELVSPGALVASVVNKGGMQVKAYISDYDMPFVEERATVVINNSATGTVARVSPSIDPKTKNVEVQILVQDPQASGLVAGQNAAVQIAGKRAAGNQELYLLPLQSVNISNAKASVFTVNGDSMLEEHEVTLGNVNGEFVEVKGGLEAGMKLVSPVYELKAGQKVSAE